MNTPLRCLIPMLGLAAVLPVLAADAGSKPTEAKKETQPRKEIRVITTTEAEHGPGAHRIVRRLGEKGEMESVTFLGVETGSVSPTLAAQLGLTEGAGLVVNHIVADSPAVGALKVHDILLKLDDQILIEQRQLSVLVRGRKEGDEVTLTYLRGGKQATAKVKLAKREVPKATALFNYAIPSGSATWFGHGAGGAGGAGGRGFEIQSLPSDVLGNREEVNRVLSLIDGAGAPGQRRISIARAAGAGDRNISVTVNTGNSRIISEDEQGSLELTIDDGQKQLVAKNANGEQLFSGPVNTPAERKALPEEVRVRLEKLEDMKQFSFKTDGEFKGAETKILRPRGQGISLPVPVSPAPAAKRPSLFF